MQIIIQVWKKGNKYYWRNYVSKRPDLIGTKVIYLCILFKHLDLGASYIFWIMFLVLLWIISVKWIKWTTNYFLLSWMGLFKEYVDITLWNSGLKVYYVIKCHCVPHSAHIDYAWTELELWSLKSNINFRMEIACTSFRSGNLLFTRLWSFN